jgi:hypothetical protein
MGTLFALFLILQVNLDVLLVLPARGVGLWLAWQWPAVRQG